MRKPPAYLRTNPAAITFREYCRISPTRGWLGWLISRFFNWPRVEGVPLYDRESDALLPFDSLPPESVKVIEPALDELHALGFTEFRFASQDNELMEHQPSIGSTVYAYHPSTRFFAKGLQSSQGEGVAKIEVFNVTIISFGPQSEIETSNNHRSRFDPGPSDNSEFYPGKSIGELLRLHEKRIQDLPFVQDGVTTVPAAPREADSNPYASPASTMPTAIKAIESVDHMLELDDAACNARLAHMISRGMYVVMSEQEVEKLQRKRGL
jgi:hypothetical protein